MTKVFRVLLVYPDLPVMFVLPLPIAIFAWILKQEGFEVSQLVSNGGIYIYMIIK